MLSLASPLVIAISLTALAKPEATALEPFANTQVEVRGPVARVTVNRVASLGSLRTHAGGQLSVFDLALPAGAQNFSVNVSALGRSPSSQQIGSRASVAPNVVEIPAALRTVAADPSASVRVAVQGGRQSELIAVRFSYTIALSCREGFWQVELPGAVDLAPVPGDLAVSVSVPPPLALAELKVGAKAFAVRGTSAKRVVDVAGQTATTVAFRLRDPGLRDGAAAMAGVWADPKTLAVVGVCRSRPKPTEKEPSVVLALIDSSNSVGAVGLSQQRSFIKAFMGALPGATRWNAVTFDRSTAKLFPLPRLATQETMALLDQALVPGRLANGTDLVGGLSALRREFAAERLEDPSGNPWVVLVSDGSLPEGTTVRAAREAAARMLEAPFASVIMRGELEEPAPPGAARVFQNLASDGRGAFRLVRADNAATAAKSLVADLLQGGDWFDVRLPGRPLAAHLPPGAGAVSTAPVPQKRSQVEFRHVRKAGFVAVHKVRLPAGWSGKAVWPPDTTTQVALSNESQAWVMPLQPGTTETPGGELERSVLRNALSLAYLPRARACYLNRPATNARLRDLQGRVRLALEIERGEVLATKVVASTLHAPDIEHCLTEAAFALAIPRPLLRDAPVEAILNLVFRSSATEPAGTPKDASAFDQELEVLLGPRPVLDDLYAPDNAEGK